VGPGSHLVESRGENKKLYSVYSNLVRCTEYSTAFLYIIKPDYDIYCTWNAQKSIDARVCVDDTPIPICRSATVSTYSEVMPKHAQKQESDNPMYVCMCGCM
jgi:hypothetical protein